MQTNLNNFGSEEGHDVIRLDLDSYTDTTYSTHNIHPYPAKFIPQIPREIISKYSAEDEWVLDPFCGSGTTLLEAKLNGRNAIGIDVNPISCLISRTKTTALTNRDREIVEKLLSVIQEDIQSGEHYDTPEYYNVDYWVQEHVQSELSVIKHQVEKCDVERVRDFMFTAMSAIFTKVSNQESDTRYKSIDKDIGQYEVWSQFSNHVSEMLQQNRELKNLCTDSDTLVLNEDIQDVNMPEQPIDLVVTSPPYPNSYDYYLYHKHRMFWLGFNPKDVQEKEFGSRYKHNDRGEGLETYIVPMENAVQKIANKLRKGRRFVVVVGDAILDGELIEMNVVLDNIFDKFGYEKEFEFRFDQRKYTRSFTPNYRKMKKNSYLLVYRL